MNLFLSVSSDKRVIRRLLGVAVLLAVCVGVAQAAGEGYYRTTRQDLRKCAWPACGGVYVKRVNRDSTRCADGVLRKDCYVAALNLQSLNLGDQTEAHFTTAFNGGRGLVRGQLHHVKQAAIGMAVSTLSASEAWLARAPTPPAYGAFHAAANNGIVCIASPCDTLALAALNSPKAAKAVAGLQLDRLKLTDAAISQINARLGQDGLLVAGVPVPVTGEAGTSVALSARQIYLPVKGTDPQPTFLCKSAEPDCPTGRFCETPAGACGDPQAVGKCSVKPEACATFYLPVCGCDGKTYGNDCARQSAGVALAHEGACQPPD